MKKDVSVTLYQKSKNREVYTPETSCVKGTSVHINNMSVKQLCIQKV